MMRRAIGILKFYLALIAARCAYIAIRLLNKSSGTAFGGLLALKVDSDFLKKCPKYIKNKIITITGTNGKSTTSGLIAHILQTAHQKVLHNLQGANMITGITNSFALNIAPLKRFDYAVIETDEAFLRKLYDKQNSDYLVVTNIFNDQLDRYGDPTTTASFIQEAIDKNPDLKLILNADDPTVANFSNNTKPIFYGLETVNSAETDNQQEAYSCPKCGKLLDYTKQFLGHEGHYSCECGYKRSECDYSGEVDIYPDHSELRITHNGIVSCFKLHTLGLYNAYNALAAITLAFECGLNQTEIQNALNSYKSLAGRTEKRTINGFETIIQLIKNPTGANVVLKTVDLNSNILIAINDEYGDGRDVSWLWDTDFELLKNTQKQIVVSGSRAYDVATRLKYAGVPTEKITIELNTKMALNSVVSCCKTDDKITILPSYTALSAINKLKLKK